MANISVIPQVAIDWLNADTSRAAAFDATYGEGRASEILAPSSTKMVSTEETNVTPEVQENDNSDMSWSSRVYDATVRAPFNGIENALKETAEFALDSYQAISPYTFSAVRSKLFGWKTTEEVNEIAEQVKTVTNNIDFVGEAETGTGMAVQGVSQFVTGLVLAGKFTKLKGVKGAFVNGALSDAIVFEPTDANITSLAEEFASKYDVDISPIADILATDPDDPRYLNRLRNAAEGAALGGLFEAIGLAVKAGKVKKQGGDPTPLTTKQKELVDGFLKTVDEGAAKEADEIIDDIQVGKEGLKQDRFKKLTEATEKLEALNKPKVKKTGLDKLKEANKKLEAINAKNQPKTFTMTPDEVAKVREASDIRSGQSLGVKSANHGFRSLDMIESHAEVLHDIAAVRDVKAKEFAEMEGTVSWAKVQRDAGLAAKRMADISGGNPKDILDRFSKGFDNEVDMAAELLARDNYYLTLESSLKDMAKLIDEGQTGSYQSMEELMLAFRQRREIAANLLLANQSSRKEIARAMNAMKMVRKGDPELRKQLLDPTMFNGDDVKAMARAIIENPNGSAIKTASEAASKLKGFLDEVNTFRINALLSGIGTQEINAVSNMINTIMIPTEQIIGGAMRLSGKDMMHGARTMATMVTTAHESLRSALKSGWMDEAILDPRNQKLEGDELLESQQKGAVKKVISIPSRALLTMDEFFKQANYRGRIQADAVLDANNLKLRGPERTAFIKDYIAKSYDETGAGIRGEALLQAQRSTFTEPLTGDMSRLLSTAAQKNSLVRFVLPFVKTPINLLSNAYQHIPVLGATSKRWRDDFAAGGARRSQALGKMAVGTSLMTLAGYLAAEDRITGSGPKDPRIRSLWLETNQPYSIRTKNEDGSVNYVSYARLEPYNQLFSIVADMVEVMKDPYNQNPEKEVMNIGVAAFAAVMENSLNKTFTKGLADTFAAITAPEKKADRFINQAVGSFIPNILNQTNGDELFRESRTMMDVLMAKTHLYNGVDAKRNPLGEVIYRPNSKADPLNLSEGGIFGEGNKYDDDLLSEMTRLSMVTQTGFENPQVKLKGPDGINLSEIMYNDTQSLYDVWMEKTGTVELKGKNLRTTLEEFIQSPQYAKLPDGEIGVTSNTKQAMIKKIIRGFREKAKSELPELVKLHKENKASVFNVLKDQVNANKGQLFPSSGSTLKAPSELEDLFK